jgi:hypothetical protein
MNEADKAAEDWGKEERRFCPSCNSTSMIGMDSASFSFGIAIGSVSPFGPLQVYRAVRIQVYYVVQSPDPEGYGYVWECDNCGAIDATDDTPDEEKDEDDE